MRNSIRSIGDAALCLLVILTACSSQQQIDTFTLKDIDGTVVRLNQKSNYLLLVTTTDCGYCVFHKPYFNELAQEFGEEYECIALYETGKRAILKQKEEFRYLPDLEGWSIIPSAEDIYLRYIEQETFPQIVVVRNGRIVTRSIGTIDPVKEELLAFLRNKK